MRRADIKENDPAIRGLAQELITEAVETWSKRPSYLSFEDGEYVFRLSAYHGQFPQGVPCFEFRPLPVAVAIICRCLPKDHTLEIDFDSIREEAAAWIAKTLRTTRSVFDFTFEMLVYLGPTLAEIDELGPFDPELQDLIKFRQLQVFDNRLRHLLKIKNKVDEDMLNEARIRNGAPYAFTDAEAIRVIDSLERPTIYGVAQRLGCSRSTVRDWSRRRGFKSFDELVRDIKGGGGK